jgi:hypothetical protein
MKKKEKDALIVELEKQAVVIGLLAEAKSYRQSLAMDESTAARDTEWSAIIDRHEAQTGWWKQAFKDFLSGAEPEVK